MPYVKNYTSLYQNYELRVEGVCFDVSSIAGVGEKH
jgi:hypothetical protein